MSLFTLTTDFGISSHYPAQVKAAVLSICPHAHFVDVTHGVRAQNVREGAIIMADVTPQFPPGTIHIAVIDPGVGTQRKLLYAQIEGQHYLLPDNGLLTPLLSRGLEEACYLEDRRWWRPTPSSTFHGRDILGPVAGHLANGVEPRLFGAPCPAPKLLPWPVVQRGARRLLGEVLLVDSFGNLITNITRTEVETFGTQRNLGIQCCGIDIRGVQATYGLSCPGETVAVFDSQGRLEIALVNGSAAQFWNIEESASVVVSVDVDS